MNIRNGLCSLILVLLSIGCSDNKPENLIAEDTYINLLIEFQLAEAFNNQYNDSTAAKKLVDSVLTVYGISYDKFLDSHDFYQSNLKAQEKRYEQAVDRLNNTMDQINPHLTKDDQKQKSNKGRIVK